MDPTIQIRPAQFADLDAIVRLWGEMMDEHSREDLRIRLSESALPAYRAYVSYLLPSSDACIRVAERERRGHWPVRGEHQPQFADVPALSATGIYPTSWSRPPAGAKGWAGRWSRIAWPGCAPSGSTACQLQFYCFNRRAEAFWSAMGFEPFYTRMWRDVPGNALPKSTPKGGRAPRMNHPEPEPAPRWQWNEDQQVGTDYTDWAEIEAYDARHSKFRDFVAEAERIFGLMPIRADQTLIDMGAGTGNIAIEAARRCPPTFMRSMFRHRCSSSRAPRHSGRASATSRFIRAAS